MKMEQTECSESSAHKIQTSGNHPEYRIQRSEHGKSLKSSSICCRLQSGTRRWPGTTQEGSTGPRRIAVRLSTKTWAASAASVAQTICDEWESRYNSVQLRYH